MTTQNNDKDKGPSRDFLLAEFSALQSRALAKEEAKSSRVNFYLVAVSAIFVGFSLVGKDQPANTDINYTLLIGSVMVIILGATTLDQVVKHSVQIVYFHRLAGRVRRYFVDLYGEIEPFVAFESNDSRPKLDIGNKFVVYRGGDAVLLSMNSIASSILVCVTLRSILNNDLAVVVVAVLAFLISWAIQIAYVRYLLKDAEKDFSSKIHFTSEKSINLPDEKELASSAETGKSHSNAK